MLRKLFGKIGTARIVALGLVALALGVRVADPIPMQIVRNLTFDFYQRVQPRIPQEFPVSIIDVDDASIAEIGQWPWPRTRFAEIVDRAREDGAVAIAFDIVFAEPDRLSPARIAEDNPSLEPSISEALKNLPDNDRILADAFARSSVIVGETSVRSGLAVAARATEIADVPHAVIGPDPDPFITRLPELVQNVPVLDAAAAGRGVFTARPDPDGIYRRMPVVASVEGHLRLGLSLELLRVGTGSEPFTVRTNEAGIDGVVLARNFFRTAGDGTVRPHLTPSLTSRLVPAADLLTGRMEPGRLSGHLVLVGTSAAGLGDYRTTPLGVQVPGVELHAQLLESILSGSLLSRPNYAIAIELVTAAILCLILIILTPIMTASFLIAATAMFLTTCALVSFLAFQQQQALIDASFPILAGLLTIVFMSMTNYLREEQRRREVRNAFKQYVSTDLVNVLTENRENLQLGGEIRDLTVMFSDVRGFTMIAEGFRDNPAGLTHLMNRLLNLLSHAILGEKGTIDKFIGDAVMAFWNAPLDHEDHARAACRAALQMRDGVRRLNAERQMEAGASEALPLHIGIGINTGSCMVGNMGSDARFDYTAMGDPVNLASRLEGQSRFYGKTIVVGSSTESIAREDFAFFELDTIRLKGKQTPERVFALLGGPDMRDDPRFAELCTANARMQSAYRARDWDRAEKALAQTEEIGLAIDPALSTYFGLMRERISAFRGTPPPEQWDGVHDAKSK